MKKTKEISITKIVLFTILVLYALSVAYLLLWGFMNSFKTNREFITKKNYFGLPSKIEIKNYIDVFKRLEVPVTKTTGKRVKVTIIGLTTNTLMYAGGVAFFATTAPLLVGYACAKFKNFYSKAIETVTLLTMMITIIGNESSYFSVLHKLNMFDTYWGFFFMKFAFTNVYLFLFKGAFSGVSSGFAEAAKIDGANELQIMLKIMFPLVRGIYGTILLLNFVTYWNDYSSVLLYLPTHPTLSYSVYHVVYVSTTSDLNETPKKLAACMMLVVPIFIVFLAFKDKFMSNLSEGGIKG